MRQGVVGGDDLNSLSPLRDSNENLKNQTSNRDFHGGPVVKNPPSNAGNTGSVAGRGTNIPPAVGGPRPYTTTTEPVCHNQRETWVPRPKLHTARNKYINRKNKPWVKQNMFDLKSTTS